MPLGFFFSDRYTMHCLPGNELKKYEPVHEKTNNLGSDTNRAVQAWRMVRCLKFWI